MQGGVLIIKARHHGKEHVTALSLTTLWQVWYNEDADAATEWLEMRNAALVARQKLGGTKSASLNAITKGA